MKLKFIFKFLINIKKLTIYKLILLYIIKPIYDLVWQYVINFKGKIYYFLWFSKKRIFIDLNKNDKLLIRNNQTFKTLASKINDFCFSNLIEKSKQEILNSNVYSSNTTNTGDKRYLQDLFPKFPNNIKKEILDLAHSELLISTAAKYLKVFPILDKIIVYHNIPNNPEDVRGPMLWHKDDFGYKSLDLFMAVSNIDNDNGPLKVIKNKNPLGVFSKSAEENKHESEKGERGKIKSNHFENIDPNNILSLEGEKGTGLLIDSFTSYHRGGHCLKNDRIMLRFSYQTPDAVRVAPVSKYYNQFEKLNDTSSTKNIFLNFLYNERPKNGLILFRNYLMKFYRILHIKEN
jgi:hypothetical protein